MLVDIFEKTKTIATDQPFLHEISYNRVSEFDDMEPCPTYSEKTHKIHELKRRDAHGTRSRFIVIKDESDVNLNDVLDHTLQHETMLYYRPAITHIEKQLVSLEKLSLWKRIFCYKAHVQKLQQYVSAIMDDV